MFQVTQIKRRVKFEAALLVLCLYLMKSSASSSLQQSL